MCFNDRIKCLVSIQHELIDFMAILIPSPNHLTCVKILKDSMEMVENDNTSKGRDNGINREKVSMKDINMQNIM